METPAGLPILYFAVSQPSTQEMNQQRPAATGWRYGSFRVRNLKHALEFLSAFKSLGWVLHQAWLIDIDGFKLTIPPEHIDERLIKSTDQLPAWQRCINDLVLDSLY